MGIWHTRHCLSQSVAVWNARRGIWGTLESGNGLNGLGRELQPLPSQHYIFRKPAKKCFPCSISMFTGDTQHCYPWLHQKTWKRLYKLIWPHNLTGIWLFCLQGVHQHKQSEGNPILHLACLHFHGHISIRASTSFIWNQLRVQAYEKVLCVSFTETRFQPRSNPHSAQTLLL